MTLKPRSPERDLTDESLAGERSKTDHEVAKRAATIEEDADLVVADARHRADAVLTRAREKENATHGQKASTVTSREAVTENRQSEDLALAEERARADDELAAERDAQRRAMSALLARERAQTDSHLEGERDRADVSVGSRDDFLAVVSHDIRNLLGGLALSAAALTKMTSEGPDSSSTPIAREAERIHRVAARMNRLVGDLLDLTSIEAGLLAVAPAQNDAAEVLRETREIFQPIADAKGISIRCEASAGALVACFDPERVLQVLANIVGNAIKFTPQGGRVDLRVEPVAAEIRFVVADTGCGIAADQLDLVFERHWQTKTRRGAGLGLGLYIARCIVVAHGGRIWAESGLGEGSRFTFSLPVAPPEDVTRR